MPQPGGNPLRVIRGHLREHRGPQLVPRGVNFVEPLGEPQRGGQSIGPFKQRRLLRRRRIVEVRVPMHTAAARLIPRLAASAQTEVISAWRKLGREQARVEDRKAATRAPSKSGGKLARQHGTRADAPDAAPGPHPDG